MSFGFIKRPRFFLPVICLAIVGLGILTVIRNMNQPSVGSISQAPQVDAVKADPYAQPGTYAGRYISFNYPAHFKKVPSKLSGTNLEVAEYTSTDSPGKALNVAVYPGAIADDSGAIYRRQHPELYTQSSSQKWLEFSKKDGTEDTFFITHDKLIATVSVTAPYKDQAGDALFVTSSLKWR